MDADTRLRGVTPAAASFTLREAPRRLSRSARQRRGPNQPSPFSCTFDRYQAEARFDIMLNDAAPLRLRKR